ncbi:hypothetical protein U1Q18_007611 [Sarracenia purpurea var. burkii]
MESPNRFNILASLGTEEEPKLGEGHLKARAPRACKNIVKDALSIRKNLREMIRDESMDKDFVNFLRTKTKSFTADVLRYDKDPDPFSLSQIKVEAKEGMTKVETFLDNNFSFSGVEEDARTPTVGDPPVNEPGYNAMKDIDEGNKKDKVSDEDPLVCEEQNFTREAVVVGKAEAGAIKGGTDSKGDGDASSEFESKRSEEDEDEVGVSENDSVKNVTEIS